MILSLQQRIDLLQQLGAYLQSPSAALHEAKQEAQRNAWFTPQFINLSLQHITGQYLRKNNLQKWLPPYYEAIEKLSPKNIGIVMAGNIPLVGFHDFLCGFVSGHNLRLKLSSKDEALFTHIIKQLFLWEPSLQNNILPELRLQNCDAYIATGSNNSSRYFEYYFEKYPHIIRRNRTSVTVLSGNETLGELNLLANDVFQYFGLGCRNVTKIYVPRQYNFAVLLEAFKKYDYLMDHSKYKNNYDYHLALYLLNNIYYMTNGNILLAENKNLFSPVSVLHYEYYEDEKNILQTLQQNPEVQIIISKKHIPFGNAQQPLLWDCADGIDTLQFLCSLP